MFGSRDITKLLNFTATFEFIPLKRERCLKHSGPKQHWHGGQWGSLLWGLLRGLLSFLSSFIKFYQVLSLIFTIRAIFLQLTGDACAWAARKDVNLQYSCNKKLSPACTGTAFCTGRSLLTYIHPWRSDLAVLTFAFIAGSIGIKNML